MGQRFNLSSLIEKHCKHMCKHSGTLHNHFCHTYNVLKINNCCEVSNVFSNCQDEVHEIAHAFCFGLHVVDESDSLPTYTRIITLGYIFILSSSIEENCKLDMWQYSGTFLEHLSIAYARNKIGARHKIATKFQKLQAIVATKFTKLHMAHDLGCR